MNSQDKKQVAGLLNFINSSPTAWHAVDQYKSLLLAQKFQELNEGEAWQLTPGGRYFVIRNGSSICAFILPKKTPLAVNIAAAHTDSPCFKLKPNAEFKKENMLMLGLEIYGGPLLTSWLNRDLGIAGRVVYSDKKAKVHQALVNLDSTPVVIPQLAIHLDRQVNENGLVLNKQEHLAALAALDDTKGDDKEGDKHQNRFLHGLLKKSLPLKELLAFDLFLYPLEQARLIGSHGEMISSYRIDNLSSMHAVMEGLARNVHASSEVIKMAAFWDNEEIGSHTAQGAGSPFVPQILERITLALGLNREHYFRIISRSLCVSIDVSHAMHPNYKEKSEPRHPVLLNKGIVIKTNAQQRYATDALSAATIITLCNEHKIPFQRYAPRGDLPCGSTIGPIHANLTGMPTVDIGCPQLSMHACRELAGTEDHLSLCRLAEAFFK